MMGGCAKWALLSGLVVCLSASAAAADDAPGWVEGSPSAGVAPPPRAPEAPGPTTYEVEQRELGKEPTRMAYPVVMAIGLGLAGFGVVAFGAGYLIYNEAPDCTDCPGSDKRGLGTGMMIGGVGGVLLGVPMAFIGGRQVPDKPSWAGVMPEVFVSPRGGLLRWRF